MKQNLSHNRLKLGITLVEMLVVICVIGLLVLLLVPNVRTSRGAVRRTQCINNLKHLSLGMLNYESANTHLPMALGAFDDALSVDDPEFRRLSGMIGLLPFMEESQFFEVIANPSEFEGIRYPAMGPVPWNTDYPPWSTQLTVLQCPSAPVKKRSFGVTNYAFCIGDTMTDIHKPVATSGAFGCRQELTFDDVKDGISKTMAFSEIRGQFLIYQPKSFLRDPKRCDTAFRENQSFGQDGRGGRWADGSAPYSLFNTVLPPNSPSCAVAGEDMADGIYSAASFHSRVVTVAMLDGSVQTVDVSIDTGSDGATTIDVTRASSESPFGIWGAMGTVAGGEGHE